jgi:hypothetical protein
MMKYRLVFISSKGQSFGFRDLAAQDDTDAIQWARRTFPDVDMELSCHGRTIAKLRNETERAVIA